MASWMVHFRIADELMNFLEVNKEQFVVGNIGPDCGEPNEDWSAFSPPASVSHWQLSSDKSEIKSEDFFQEYLQNNVDQEKKSFYLGYYIHLLTDILWSIKIVKPTKKKYQKQFSEDKNFIWKIKEDWYDLDHKYIKNHPDFRAFRIFDKLSSFPNVYLDFYSDTAIEKRIHYISNFYNTYEGNLDREYPYLDEEQMNIFVTEAMEEILEELRKRGLMND